MAQSTMNILDLEGTPRQCGQAHGEALRDQIQEIREIFLAEAGLPGPAELEALCLQLLGQTGFLDAARRWTPDLYEEIEGICEGAGVGRGFIWTFQHQDEVINLTGELRVGPASSGNACTSLGSSPSNGSPTLLAQNLDTPAIYHGHQTVLKVRYRGSDHQVLVISEPGLVGICGMNNQGLGVCQNTLAWQLNRSYRGLAAMLVARSLLGQSSLAAAVRFLQTIPHASGINFALGDPGGVADWECSPSQVVQFIPDGMPGRIYHTNHPLVNTDRYPPERLPRDAGDYYTRFLSNSQARFTSVSRRMEAAPHPLTVRAVQDILAAHDSDEYPVCRHIRPELGRMGGCTNNTLIMELTSSPRLLVSAEPPCQYDYQDFHFR